MSKADIGLVGLAVMGENLILNMESKGFTVAVFNRTTSKVDDFVNGRAKGKKIVGAHSVEELVSLAEAPAQGHDHGQGGRGGRRLHRAAPPAPRAGRHPHRRRQLALPRHDPAHRVRRGARACSTSAPASPAARRARSRARRSCPAARPAAWPHVKPIFQAIAAKIDDGTPCCDWVGENGAGHFVKMVHNGIEYGDMQLICEAYDILKNGLGMSADEMHEVFAEWNEGELDSYLIEITRDILGYKDEDGEPLVDKILDTAGQKGTGKWTGDRGARARRPADPDRRGGLRPLPLGPQGGAGRGVEGAARARRRRSRATGRPSSRTSGRRSTPRRSSPTRRATR